MQMRSTDVHFRKVVDIIETFLKWNKTCRSLGCLEPGCALCAQNPNRRCSANFSSKYLAGDVLKAKCGASIRVDIVTRAALEPASTSATAGIHLEVSLSTGMQSLQLEAALCYIRHQKFTSAIKSCD